MRLSDMEFRAMNGRLRRLAQRHLEFPVLVRMGLGACADGDVVEFGCGNGLGAELISALGPRSYVGLDVMPEQIALAERRALPNARFLVGDATRAATLPDACADVVVIFGVLHHVEAWPEAILECRRLLRPNGVLIVEEPDRALLRAWDRVFHWDHPREGFSLRGLERELATGGLCLERRLIVPGVFGVYRARMSGDSPCGSDGKQPGGCSGGRGL